VIPAAIVSFAAVFALAALRLVPSVGAPLVLVAAFGVAGAFAAVRTLETQLLARGAWLLLAVLGALVLYHSMRSGNERSVGLVLFVGAAGALVVAREAGLDARATPRFQPTAHRARLLVAVVLALSLAAITTLWTAHLAESAYRHSLHAFPFWRTRYYATHQALLAAAFGASVVVTMIGALALVRMRTLGLVLLLGGELLALAAALRGHVLVKGGFAAIVTATLVVQAILVAPFLRGMVTSLARRRATYAT
jgi:hypothetical protein